MPTATLSTTRPRRSNRTVIKRARDLTGIDDALVLGLVASVDAVMCSSPHRWSPEDMDAAVSWIDSIESMGFGVLADQLLEQLIGMAIQERQSPTTRKGKPNRPR